MKLVVFGLTISSSWGNGHATLWRGLCRALAGRGHAIVFFEHDVPFYALHRDYDRIPGGDLVLYTSWDEVLPRARRALADADIGIVTSYCPDGIAASQLVLDSPVQLRTFYDLDTPVTLEALRAGQSLTYIGPRGFHDFDLVLSYTGGVALAEIETQLGARRVAPLYAHVDPAVHHAVPPVDAYRCDLSYLGAYAEDRQATLNALFIETARRLGGLRFLIGGAPYPADFSWTENVFFVQHVPPAEHPAFFSSSRLTLNVTPRAMATMGFCPSGCLFEAAVCGTPLLSDPWPGLEMFFEPGREILVARTTEEAVRALERSDAELARMASAARERTLAENTSEQRAIYLERVFDDAIGGAKSPGVALPDYSDTESSVSGAAAAQEASVDSRGGNALKQPGTSSHA